MKFFLLCQVHSLGSSACCLPVEQPFSEVSLVFDCLVCRTLVILVTSAPPSGWLRLISGFKSYWRRAHLHLWQIQAHTHMKIQMNRHIMMVHTYFPRSQMKTLQTLFARRLRAHPCYCEQSQCLSVQETCSESASELN